VLDSIREDGAKLVEMSEADSKKLRTTHPDILIAPVVYYELATARRLRPRAAPSLLGVQPAATPGIPGQIQVRVIDANSSAGVENALVVAFTDFTNRFGADGRTDSNGNAVINLGTSSVQIERLYVYPPLAGYWGAYRENFTLQPGFQVSLQPIDLSFVDSLRHFHGAGQPTTDGSGVTVGVIDTGVGPHPDLNSTGDIDNGEGHGTHVAGIIAANGTPPNGIRGIAPGVTLRSYRVFSAPGGLAANFTIAQAIDQAVLDGCDIINLSLKIDNQFDPSGFVIDPVVQSALQDARDAGVLPIAAAGNDNRTVVDFPGRDPTCLAVSALGRAGTFPSGSLEEGDILRPPTGTDPSNFIAAFSNFGPDVDLTGPGVGIVSTVPGGHGVLSGTSMACPAVTGMAARLIAQNPTILNMQHNAARSASMASLIMQSAQTLGFDIEYEGQGILV
jgi:subtilisin